MKKARKIILGTDWWTDCDDCVAVRLLANAHKKSEIELLAIGINGCMEYSAPSLSAFLTAEGLGDIPLGIDLDGTDFAGDYHKYQKPLCNYPHRIKRNEDCENAVEMYRRILKESEDKVDIIEIGFCQIVSGLLESDGGIDLVKEKVNKFYVMAGQWDRENGMEHNFNNNLRSRMAGHILCEKCPVPITFLGFEVGLSVLTGDSQPENDLLTVVLTHYGCAENGRCSWDPMTALLAVIGDEEKAGYKTVRGTAKVNPETGENNFIVGDGLHCYVIKNEPDSYYRNAIQERIKKLDAEY